MAGLASSLFSYSCMARVCGAITSVCKSNGTKERDRKRWKRRDSKRDNKTDRTLSFVLFLALALALQPNTISNHPSYHTR